MYTEVSDVYRASLLKLTVSLAAEILAQRDTVVSMRAQLVNGRKNPSKSMYKK